jgi:hypothetical protein
MVAEEMGSIPLQEQKNWRVPAHPDKMENCSWYVENVGSSPSVPTKWLLRPTGQDIGLLNREYGFESRRNYKEYWQLAERTMATDC